MATTRIIDKKSGSVREAPNDERLSALRPSIYVMKVGPDRVASFTKRGNDLVLVLKDGRTIVIEGFFVKHGQNEQAPSEGVTPTGDAARDASGTEAESGRSDLVLEDAEGVAWWGQYPEQWSEFHFTEIETNFSLASAGLSSAPLLGGSLAVGALGALIGGSGGDDNNEDQPEDDEGLLSAADDSAATSEDTPVTGSVADNDHTTGTGTLTFAKASDPAHGTVVVNSNGTYTYTPHANYSGQDSFTYTVTDSATGDELTQTVTVTVGAVTDLTALNDSATTSEDTPVSGSVAGNDATTSGGTLAFAKASDPANGTVVVNTDGTYTYTPRTNFNGQDSFTYTVTDPASRESLTRTVTITVSAVGDLAALDDSNTTDEDRAVSGSVAGNDATTSGGTLTFAKASDPANGTVVVDSDGTYTYTPRTDFNGQDSFTYTVTDAASGETLTRTVTITVNPVSDAPVVTGGDQSDDVAEAGHLDDGTVVNGVSVASGSFTATDADGDAVTWSVLGTLDGSDLAPADATYGNFSIDPVSGAWNYALNNSLAATQALNEGDRVSLTYVVEAADGDGGSATRTVTITVVGTNDAPVTSADTAAVVEAGVLEGGNTGTGGTVSATGNVLSNDTDPDLGETATLTVAAVNFGATTGVLGSSLAGTYGSLVLNANGSYEYTLDNNLAATQALKQGQAITEVFGYSAQDANGATRASTLTVTVTGTNDRPEITSTTSDASGAVIETGTNQPGVPTASGELSATDADSGATETWSILDPAGSYGSLAIDPSTGVWTYTLDNARTATQALDDGDVRTETFTARVMDEHGAFREQAVTITLNGSNDVPTGTGAAVVALDEDSSALGTLQAYVTDVDDAVEVTSFSVDADGDGTDESFTPGGSPVAIEDAAGNLLGTLTIAVNGDFSFTPAGNYAGEVPTVTYTMSEVGAGSASITQTIDFAITKLADAPAMAANKTINAVEDTSIALGLIAPVITDAGAGAGTGDYSERMGPITLTISGSGADGVTLASGAEVLTFAEGVITIVLTDGVHVDSVPAERPASGVYHLTTAEYEALQVVPAAESGRDFQIAVGATSYEVDAGGTIIASVEGSTSTQLIDVDVQAVTDGASLTIDGSTTATHVADEDTPFDVASHLAAALSDADSNLGTDTDNSETYWYSVTNLPVGSVVNFDGTSTTVTSPAQIVSSAASTSTTPPTFTITAPEDFSGELTGITISLNTQDTDTDSSGTPSTLVSSVTLNLQVNAIAGDVVADGVSTPEDTPVAFLSGVRTSDDGTGDEVINSVSFTGPAGWTITAPMGLAGWSNTGSGSSYVIEFDDSLTEAEREAILDAFSILPPAHSSADATIALAITSTDTSGSGANTQTVNRDLTVTVTAVAERTDTDSNGNGSNDVTLTAGHTYVATGQEDTWFDLNADPSFNLATGWSHEDTDEQLFAVLTPTLASAAATDTVIGTQFRYSTDGGTSFVTETYTGAAVWVPVEYLDTLEVKLPPNVAGTLTIGVQAGTVDIDPNGGAPVRDTSGSATLSMIEFEGVAEAATMSLNGRATGLEDSEIPLRVEVVSSDASETFDLTIAGIPAGATIVYGGAVLPSVGGSVTISGFSNGTPLAINPPPDSNSDFTLTVSAVAIDGTDTSRPVSRTIDVAVTGVADTPQVTPATPAFSTSEAALDSGTNEVALSSLVTAVVATDIDGSETVALRIFGLPEGFSVSGAIAVVSGSGAERVWVTSVANLGNVRIGVPENYSGTVQLQVAGVATEDDGDSITGGPVPISFTVEPSPEATVTTSAIIIEDQISPLNLAIVHANGDTDERLGEVYSRSITTRATTLCCSMASRWLPRTCRRPPLKA